MNAILKKAQSSPDAALQFVVDSQYDQLLEQAIGAKVVNSDVGREGLYDTLKDIAASGDQDTFAYILSAPVSFDGMSPEAQEAMEWALRNAKTPNGLRMAASVQQGSSGTTWTSENTNTAMTAFSSLIGSFLNYFQDAPAPPSGGGNGQPAPAPAAGDSGMGKYLPWVLGGIGVLVVVIVLVVALRKK